jgi:hypothetical protein
MSDSRLIKQTSEAHAALAIFAVDVVAAAARNTSKIDLNKSAATLGKMHATTIDNQLLGSTARSRSRPQWTKGDHIVEIRGSAGS